MNIRAVRRAFGPFFAFCLVYFAMACSTAVAEESVSEKTMSAVRNCKEHFRIFIDVGHYRKAPGATSARGKTEFDFNLLLAKTLEVTLVKKGYSQIKLFVSDGGSQSLRMRVRESQKFKADIFISIHHDDVQSRYKSTWIFEQKKRLYSDEFKGYSLFISKLNPAWPESLRFATLVADEFLRRGMTFTRHHAEQIEGEGRQLLDENRGIYQYDELIVLKENASPAVLIEAGVIINRDEELILGTPARRELFSEAVSEAVQNFCVTKLVTDQQ